MFFCKKKKKKKKFLKLDQGMNSKEFPSSLLNWKSTYLSDDEWSLVEIVLLYAQKEEVFIK